MSKNDLIEQLLNSDIEENRVFGTLLLSSEQIPEEEREPYIMQLVADYLRDDSKIPKDIRTNILNAYKGLSKTRSIKHRIVKL
jgi:hypothetical protein